MKHRKALNHHTGEGGTINTMISAFITGIPSTTTCVIPDAVSSSDDPAASDISSSTVNLPVLLYCNLPLDLSLDTQELTVFI